MKDDLLLNKAEATKIYDKRYHEGYIEDWPVETKNRICEIIQNSNLPQKGKALDFGCGTGALTEILRSILPDWRIYGTDISKTAIEHAKIWFPKCVFFKLEDPDYREMKFDFVFSHHVFEHVYNLQEAFYQMINFLKPSSSMLHILPCGNEGSFEYNVCALRKDGIHRNMENRFFFEEVDGHVRRLTTENLREFSEQKGFHLEKEYYRNHYYGAIEWITNSHPKFVWTFTDGSSAINKSAKYQLIKLRYYLLPVTLLRLPAQVVEKYLLKRRKRIKHIMMFIAVLPFYIFSLPLHFFLKNKAKDEWIRKRTHRNGSEMSLLFKRTV